MKFIVPLLIFTLCEYYSVFASEVNFPAEHYTKAEYQIPMRDGVKLYTIVYSPKDTSQSYPILMQRTCYSIGPYGKDTFPAKLGPSVFLMKEGYIFVYQDVRGRYMSEGTFDNMRPHVEGNDVHATVDIDESSDTFDTIEWLLKNVKNNNGKVGQWGISYPGFYTAAALPEAHPALVASSPQAPIADFYFDDFHHRGTFIQSYLPVFPLFGYQKDTLTTVSWYGGHKEKLYSLGNTHDAYDFNLKLGPLKNVKKYYPDDFFWNQISKHPNYDSFWQKRNILPHLDSIDHAVMVVGGWFDAEDLYGPLNIYKTIEQRNPKSKNTIVMGPWSHGDWSREKGYQAVNHIYFGDSISTFYQKNIELPFFNYYLKGKGVMQLPEAYMFDTGLKEWKKFDHWPPTDIPPVVLRFEEGGKLLINELPQKESSYSYISDPAKPVPYRSEIAPLRSTPRPFMTDDQRHASQRPDVLTFETEPLTEDLIMAGEIIVNLTVSLTTTDADFIVKLIDVYPDDEPATKATPKHVILGGYQQLVRHETMRGRYRNSFEFPEPFVPNQKEEVRFPLQDILHTFKKGHRVMIQIHSTWFPYIDRNPQKYVDNIYEADEKDFVISTITVYGSGSITIGEPPKPEPGYELEVK
jgi:uncharacterized protein